MYVPFTFLSDILRQQALLNPMAKCEAHRI